MLFTELNDYKRSDLILFVLDGVDKIGLKPIEKKQFQKIIYIIEASSPLRKIIDNFIYRKKDYGPYSKDIQNTLNILRVFGLLGIGDFKPFISGGKKFLRISYKISDRGREVVRKLQKYSEYNKEYLWVLKILKIIKLYGVENILGMVYAEPTFEKIMKSHDLVPINDVQKNLSIELMEFLRKVSEEEFDYNIDNEDILLIYFFDYLYTKKSLGE